jgi:riboflavin kinase/FMN adenylyltransferase
MGRPYAIEEKVIPGDQQGRKIGFPTANLSLLEPFLIPRYGVYIVSVDIGKQKASGLMNIGVRPTVAQETPQERLEVHLFNVKQNLYGKTLRVELLHYLREERKFSSFKELKEQLHRDKEEAKSWLTSRPIKTSLSQL